MNAVTTIKHNCTVKHDFLKGTISLENLDHSLGKSVSGDFLKGKVSLENLLERQSHEKNTTYHLEIILFLRSFGSNSFKNSKKV